MKLKRKFFQIYAEFEGIRFDGIKKTENTLRASIIQALARHNIIEYIPKRKQQYTFAEDLIKINNPEAEIKIGGSCDGQIYIQVSVSDKDMLLDLFAYVEATIAEWDMLGGP